MSVFHLKYRPQNFDELDNTQAAILLGKIFENENWPQSFLFAGPKGSGKTSAARIISRLINCESRNKQGPCGKCTNCREIFKGGSLDVVEIDAASNRGIEDVRGLKEKAYLLPTRLKWKVMVIDEVHMLTKEAFNALLKLLEEPPQNTMFILCTTDPNKIPETVLSRLTRVDFKKGTQGNLEKSLMRVVEGEGVKIDGESIKMLTEKSDGSFRNLHRTFLELVLEYGKNLDKEMVAKFFQERQGEYGEEEIEDDLVNRKEKQIIERLESMAEKGVDFGEYREKLIRYFQKKLLGFYWQDEMRKLTKEELTEWLNILIATGRYQRDVVVEQLPLELAVIEFLKGKNSNGEDAELVKSEKKDDEKEDEKEEKKLDIAVDIADIPTVVAIGQIEEAWGRILTEVKPYNHSVEAFLRAARPKAVTGRTLEIEVFYPFHKERLEEARNRKILEAVLTKVFGIDLIFECVLAKNAKKPLIINNQTPMEKVSPILAEEKKEERSEGKDLYDVAKDIFG